MLIKLTEFGIHKTPKWHNQNEAQSGQTHAANDPQPPNTTPRTPADNIQQQSEHIFVSENTTASVSN